MKKDSIALQYSGHDQYTIIGYKALPRGKRDPADPS